MGKCGSFSFFEGVQEQNRPSCMQKQVLFFLSFKSKCALLLCKVVAAVEGEQISEEASVIWAATMMIALLWHFAAWNRKQN